MLTGPSREILNMSERRRSLGFFAGKWIEAPGTNPFFGVHDGSAFPRFEAGMARFLKHL